MKLTFFLLLSLSIGFSPLLVAQQSTTEIQKEADNIKSKEGTTSFDYAEKLLELTKAYQKENNFEKAKSLDQEVSGILKEFSDSIPEDYEAEYAIKEKLENLLLEQYLTRWQGFIGQERYPEAQQLISDKDWVKRSIKIKQYLDIISLLQVAHQTIGSQHKDYLENWNAAYYLYTDVSYYNLQQTKNLWKAITLHRAKETAEDHPANIEVLFGYANFSNRTNDTETYETLKTKVEKHWPYAFGNKATVLTAPPIKKNSPPKNTPVEKEEEPRPDQEINVSSEMTDDDSELPEPPPEPPFEEDTESVHFTVEVMPRFPGCEAAKGDDKAKKSCADQRLLQFIYSKIKYPEIARESGIEGMAVVSFVITEYGTIIDFKILRDPGGACGKEALRVVKLMNELPSRWTPGRQDGENVRVKFNLPVRFKLN